MADHGPVGPIRLANGVVVGEPLTVVRHFIRVDGSYRAYDLAPVLVESETHRGGCPRRQSTNGPDVHVDGCLGHRGAVSDRAHAGGRRGGKPLSLTTTSVAPGFADLYRAFDGIAGIGKEQQDRPQEAPRAGPDPRRRRRRVPHQVSEYSCRVRPCPPRHRAHPCLQADCWPTCLRCKQFVPSSKRRDPAHRVPAPRHCCVGVFRHLRTRLATSIRPASRQSPNGGARIRAAAVGQPTGLLDVFVDDLDTPTPPGWKPTAVASS